MTTHHVKFCIHTALQLVGLTTEKFRPTALQKYIEGWSSESKRICILMKHLLSRESYELTRVKVFDMRWSSIVKGQSKTLAHA